MSTKNLARTVVEGGRTGSWKMERDRYTTKERAQRRDYLRLVQRSDDPDDVDIPLGRLPAGKEFDDHLNPMLRFLDARVGQSWSNTYSEIRKKFDDRTMAGRHIMHDHLLQSIRGAGQREMSPGGWGYYAEYYVDKQGILRKAKRNRNGSSKGQTWHPWKVCEWLGNRRIRQSGTKCYWLEPTRDPNIGTDYHKGQFRQVMLDEDGEFRLEHIPGFYEKRTYASVWREPHTEKIEFVQPMRQADEFSAEDYRYFNALPSSVREKLTAS